METKRAVLYARVSRDDRVNEGRNLDGQREMCRQHALGKGWSVIAKLAEDDRGASGASGARLDLPKLNEALDLAQRREFDGLVVRELDRLTHSLPKQLLVESIMAESEIQIEYVLGECPDTPKGVFLKNVRVAVAELERRKTVERTARSRIQAVKEGNSSTIRIWRTGGHAAIPLNYKAANALKKWPEVHEPISDTALFLTTVKKPMGKQTAQLKLKKYLKEAEIANASVQTPRHTMTAHH